MRNHNPGARRYLREVRSWLPCSRKLKRKILEEISETIAEYLCENPGAAYPELTARFGTPQQIAASYVEEMETGELLRDLRIRKKIVRVITATAVAVVVLWLGAVSVALIKCNINMNGYAVITVTQEENEPVNEGE